MIDMTRALGAFVLGAVLTAAAPVAKAGGLDAETRATLEALRAGGLTKLVVHEEAKPPLAATFLDADGATRSLADFRGKAVLVNFWATWCGPCRIEMPSINRLAGTLGTDAFAVVAISLDRMEPARPQAFLDQIEATHLPFYQDRTNEIAKEAGLIGLPVSLLLDRSGNEVARLTGHAEWDEGPGEAILREIANASAGG
ncbi:MAG: TlpA disulfide reductase family protein [Paracoccaceae bacterium]